MTNRTAKLAIVLLGFALLAVLPRTVRAMWARMKSEPVPVERLVKNVQTYIEAHPKDAEGYLVLARVHSRAFAERAATLTTYRSFRDNPANDDPTTHLPDVTSPGSSILEARAPGSAALDAAAKDHLAESVRSFRRAIQLSPDNAIAFLGLGWMLEQGIPYADQVDAPFSDKPGPASKAAWRQQALAAYRAAYSLRIDQDLGRGYSGPGGDTDVSREAGEGILRLLDPATATAEEKSEIARVSAAVKKMTSRGEAVTPIIFPIHAPEPLDALLAPGSHVSFDLAGNGRGAEWPWVNSDAAFLVWDPRNEQRIASGRQLFGSATWWMFWRNGYEALAALDDDANGWLEGAELDGIAIWRDVNGNGICDPGEIISLRDAGIVRISVRATERDGETLLNPQGIQLANGSFLPTYDWTPRSLASPGAAAHSHTESSSPARK